MFDVPVLKESGPALIPELACAVLVMALEAEIENFEFMLKAAVADESLKMVAILSDLISTHRGIIERAKEEFEKDIVKYRLEDARIGLLDSSLRENHAPEKEKEGN